MDSSTLTLFSMVFLLGLRHGFDLDHLATIDAMTRTVNQQALYARLCGFFFSLGHGLVVIMISFIIGVGLLSGRIPSWLDMTGQVISIFFLLLFSILTFWQSLQANPDTLHGFKFHFYKRLLPQRITPVIMIFIGAIFAFSFDTFSQVALFSLSARNLITGFPSVLFGIIFMIGMMVSDGVNGLLVAKLLRGAQHFSTKLYRYAGLLTSAFSFSIFIMGLFKLIRI